MHPSVYTAYRMLSNELTQHWTSSVDFYYSYTGISLESRCPRVLEQETGPRLASDSALEMHVWKVALCKAVTATSLWKWQVDKLTGGISVHNRLRKNRMSLYSFSRHSHLPRIGEIKNTTSSILTRYYNGCLYHLCIFTHAYRKGPHTYKALQAVGSVSHIPSKATTNYTLIALVKIRETFKSFFVLFFPHLNTARKVLYLCSEYFPISYIWGCKRLPPLPKKKKKKISRLGYCRAITSSSWNKAYKSHIGSTKKPRTEEEINGQNTPLLV